MTHQTDDERERVIDALRDLANQYPRFDPTPAQLARYAGQLADLPLPVVLAAIDRAGLVGTFYPSVAEIRDEVAIAAAGHDTAETAWIEVRAEAQRVGYNRPPLFVNGEWVERPTPRFSTPLIAQAVETVGWNVICTSPSARTDFIWAFRNLRERIVSAITRGDLPEALAGIERGARDPEPTRLIERTTRRQPWLGAANESAPQ